MSRKLLVASVCTASVVALGTAAVANVGLSTDNVRNAVTAQTNLDNLVQNNLNGRDVVLPSRRGDVIQALEELRGDLARGSLTLPEGKVEQGSRRLANSVAGLANSIERGNERLPGDETRSLERLTTGLERVAADLRAVPDQRVHDSVTDNEELARALYGLEAGLQRLHEMDTSEALNGPASNVLDAGPVEDHLADVLEQAASLARD